VSRAAAVVVAAALLPASAADAQDLPWALWNDPKLIARLDASDIVLERSSHCLDGCRYDRSNPGGETDNAYPLRWTYRDGDEAIVFDERGPGAVTRIWMTTGFGHSTCIDPAIRVRFHVDDLAAPVLDAPLAALFDGSMPPFTAPVAAGAAGSSGGYLSRLPIAFARSLRIGLLDAENGPNPCQSDPAHANERLLWFQLQHHRLAPGTAVESFDGVRDEPGWRAFLGHAGDDPWNGLLAPQNAAVVVAPGHASTLAARTGPGWLRGIRLRLPRAAYADVRLRLAFDAQVAVDVPLADFFATAPGASVPARGVLVGEDADGWLYAWFPMPFAHDAEVALAAGDDLAAPTAVDAALSFDMQPVPDDAGRFSTRLAEDCVDGGTVTLYADRGAGKLVGIAARYDAGGSSSRAYLEGNERAYVDDAIAPAWLGTGVEDFHDGGFYFDRGPFAGAAAGATEVDADGTGVTAAYRLLLTDPIIYASALRLTQEAGYSPSLPRPMCARSVAYAYRRAQPLVVSYDAFDVGDAGAAAAHAYAAPDGAECDALTSRFEDEAATARTAVACRYAAGASGFRLQADGAPASPLRLRRTFDVGGGMPGRDAGSAAAVVRVNGAVAGWFPPAPANPARRWQQQEILLDPAIGAGTLQIRVEPEFSAYATRFSESRWELRGGWKDAIFDDGFDARP
jgi:hypothetical protein